MVIFHSYVSLPEGIHFIDSPVMVDQNHWEHIRQIADQTNP